MEVIVAPRDGVMPFEPEVIGFEMDVDMIMRRDAAPTTPDETTEQLVEAMQEPSKLELGQLIWRDADPYVALLVVHDLDREPSCDREAVAQAMLGFFEEAAERGFCDIALSLQGSISGEAFGEHVCSLLHEVTEVTGEPPERLWLMVEET